MLDLLVLVDQNMVCGSSKDHFPRMHLDVSVFSGIHQMCIPSFPFDPHAQSDTLKFITLRPLVVAEQSEGIFKATS